MGSYVNTTGCARSDFTTCLPVPWRGWGPLVRSKQAVSRVLDFDRIGVLDLSCHGGRIGQKHQSRLKLGPLVLLRALHKMHWRLLKSDSCFGGCGGPKMSLMAVFQSLVIWWRMGQMHRKLARFVSR